MMFNVLYRCFFTSLFIIDLKIFQRFGSFSFLFFGLSIANMNDAIKQELDTDQRKNVKLLFKRTLYMKQLSSNIYKASTKTTQQRCLIKQRELIKIIAGNH